MFAAGLGHEVPSLLAVVTAFFGGMALGGWTLDRRIAVSPNPAQWYGRLQLVIGGWGVVITLLIPSLNALALALTGVQASPFRQGLVCFALPFLALLPATAAIGATLPAMERWLASATDNPRCVARVYAVNTTGAVAGTLSAAFVLMPALGFRASALIFAALNLLCAATVGRGVLTAPPSVQRNDGGLRTVGPTLASEVGTPRLLLTALVTGLLGIGFEIVGVRLLSQALEGTLYTFAAVLAVYLLGTASGAALYQRFAQGRPFRSTLNSLLIALATVCLGETWLLSQALNLYDASRSTLGDSLAGVILAEILVALAIFLLPTLLTGATYSHLVQAARRAEGGVGRASALNTLGGALAGIVFGIALLPPFGAKWTLVLLALSYLVLIPQWTKLTSLGIALPVVLVFLLPGELRLTRLPPGATVREFREGVMASVAVLETPDGHRSLRVNNRFQMGSTAAALAQRRQAHIPLLLHPAPRRALFLGPGTGITLGAAREHPGLAATGVELIPEVVELIRHFEPENKGPFQRAVPSEIRDPKFEIAQGLFTPAPTILVADARRFVRASGERYHVIVADLFHPAQDGAGFLYTREHFEAVRQRLAPGGLFCQWLPLHQLDAATLQIIFRTFLGTFRESHAFLLHFNVDIPVLGLVGSAQPLRVTPDTVERRLIDPAFRHAMKSAGLDRTINLLGCVVAGPESLASFAGNGVLNTDDHPMVSFAAPRFSVRRNVPPHETLVKFLQRTRVDPATLLSPDAESAGLAARLTDFIGARDVYLRGLITEANGELSTAVDAYLEASKRSLYFTPAYARLVNIIQVMATTDRAAARELFNRLEVAQPGQPLGRQMLGSLLEEPRLR